MVIFEQPFYEVAESSGFVEVCVVPAHTATFQMSASINISTVDMSSANGEASLLLAVDGIEC